MAEIDPVILQLRADFAQYRADVEGVTRRVTEQLGVQEKSVVQLETQIKRSSSNISSSFKTITTSLAAGFSVRQVADMADSYTRFTNQLKVAGLESGNLAKTQNRLFEVAQRNGVEIEAVGTLYSRAAQNQKELGASTEDLISLTRSVSASLRISGESTTEASGALLQLGQALGSPRVQAEEFNSLLDTMQPLLRGASKYIDGTGGSLAGLTQKIKDQKGPGVSNVELFRAIIKAMADLEKTASETTLTIGGAFTNLSNALTKYIGEADSANGATVMVTGALNALAENLDTVTEAIAVLGALMLGRFVASMTAGAVASAGASAAIFALQARAGGAATTMEALAFAGSAAGRSLLAAFGGPVGLAVTALTVGIGYLVQKQQEAKQAAEALDASISQQTAQFASLHAAQAKAAAETNNLTSEQRAAITATANLTGEANKLSQAWARVAAQAKAASVEQAKAALYQARRNTNQARSAYNARVQSELDNPASRPFAERGQSKGVLNNPGQALANAQAAASAEKKRYDEASQNVRDARSEYDRIVSTPLASFKVDTTPTAGAKESGKGTKKGSAKRTDPSEVARRFADDFAAGQLAIEQAQADALGTAEARRGLEYSQIEYERDRNARQIAADKDTTEAQKTQLLQQNDRIAAEKKAAVYADAQREAKERQAQAEQNSAQYAEDALRADAAMATTRQASLEANLRILDSLEAQEKAHLKAQIAAGEIADVEKARADLTKTQTARRTTTERNHESPLDQKRRQVRETADNMGDAIQNIEVDAVDRLSDGIANASKEYIKLGGVAGEVINGIIADLVKLAVQQAMLGSAGGGIFKLFGLGGLSSSGIAAANTTVGSTIAANPALFASGGYTGDGPVHEPAGIVHKGEYVIPASAVKRIGVQNLAALANGRAAASMASVTAAGVAARAVQQTVTVHVQASDYFDARVDQRATNVAVPIGVASSVQARTAAGTDAARASRRRIPGR